MTANTGWVNVGVDHDTELDALRARLTPGQEARREQPRYVLRGGRRVATTGRNRSPLSSADEVLVTIVYLHQACSPLWWSPMTSRIPDRPRSRSERGNPLRNTSVSLPPTISPSTSRQPSRVMPVATATARGTIGGF